MGNIFTIFITKPLGLILGLMYTITNSYGMAIILFTILTKIILLPLALKQQKAMVEMQKIQPLLAEVQKKYKNDKEKLNEETMKLYKEHNVNPFGSCLPLLIQIPIIYGLFSVINHPLSYILNLSKENIFKIFQFLSDKVVFTPGINQNNILTYEIEIAKQMIGKVSEIANTIGISTLKAINFNFLGIFNLALKPMAPSMETLYNMQKLTDYLKGEYFPLLIIPILAAVTTYYQSKLTPQTQPQSSQNSEAADMQNSMMKIFPIMTFFFAFMMPSGVGLYWVASGAVQIAQQYFLNKYYTPKIKGGENKVEQKSSGKNRKNNR